MKPNRARTDNTRLLITRVVIVFAVIIAGVVVSFTAFMLIASNGPIEGGIKSGFSVLQAKRAELEAKTKVPAVDSQ